jgi:serine/threonine-protein kinase
LAGTEALLLQQLGKYQVIRKLASGGMAEVFLVKAAGPMGFEKTLVLKRILPNLAADRQFVQMFLAEAKLAASLNHPNIAQIFDFGQAEGAYFIAMEHVDGPNLRSVARRSAERSIPLPVSLCAKIISYACEALAYAHEFIDPGTATPLSVIHRDVSPENIILSRSGAVKVVDFGIAKAVGQTHHTGSGILRGKISYMTPEQIQGKEIDHRADIFALGVVFYELMTGWKPFDARSDVTILQAILYEQMIPAVARRPDIPEPITRILQRALAKDPDARYPTCRHFQADLERFIVGTGEPVGPYQLAALVAKLRGQPSSAPVSLPEQPPPARQRAPSPSLTPPLPAPARAKGAPAAVFASRKQQPLPRNASRESAAAQAGPRRGAAIATLLGTAAIIAAVGFVLFQRSSREEAVASTTEADAAPPGTFSTRSGEDLARATETPMAAHSEPRAEQAAGASAERGTRKNVHRDVGQRIASRGRSRHAGEAATAGSDSASGSSEKGPGVASVAVESSPPGQVFINGKLIGASPVRIKSLAAGEVRVEVSNSAAGFSKQQVFNLVAGDNGTKRIVVERGSLEFRVRPFASVFLDGKLVGQTPFPPIQAYEGRHAIRLVNSELKKEIAVEYVVKPGQANVFKYNLAQAAD